MCPNIYYRYPTIKREIIRIFSVFKNIAKNSNFIFINLIFTTIIVIVIYLLINIAFLHVLPVSAIANAPLAAANVANVVFGQKGGLIVTVVAFFSILSILNAYMMIPARILFGLSRDGFFIKQGALVNKGGTPVTGLLFATVMNFILIILGSFDELFSLGSFLEVIIMGLVFASLLKLRQTEPDLPRPYRAWGFPYAPIIMVIISAALFIGFAFSDHFNLFIIASLALASYPAYKFLTRNKQL